MHNKFLGGMHIGTFTPRIYRYPIANTYAGLQRGKRISRLFSIHKHLFDFLI